MDGSPAITLTNYSGVPYDYNTAEKSHYSAKPPTFSGDPTQFKWWKSKMYTYIIGHEDALWDIL